MKKLLSLVAIAMTIGITSCSDDECTHGPIDPPNNCNVCHQNPCICRDRIVGSWYEEAENEEIRFGENGTFYDCYANYQRCAESEGSWEYDSNNRKLTWHYPYLGQIQYADWTVKNMTEFGFTISSTTVADHNLEKIVESYDLMVGKTANIEFSKLYPDLSVLSYTSNNERIASVTPDGRIKAEGEKGVTYIKINTTKTNVWVKVVVGDNCSEMWFDYVGLMGLDYSKMRKVLNRLGEPYSGEDGYSFGFIHQFHDVADITKVFLCPEDGMVTEVQLLLKESVPEAEILSYMNSRYYKLAEDESIAFYSSVEDPETSKAIVAYKKADKCVIFNETQHFLHNPHVKDLWTDFVPLFGNDKKQVKAAMDEYGYSFLMSDYSYSKDGSDYYYITDNNYAEMVGFVFNPDLQVSEFWVYMNINSDPNDVYDYLCAKYKENESESSQYNLVFYNDDKSMKVTFDLKNTAVIYTKLTMKQHESNTDMLGAYYEGLGMTHDQIIAKYGTPFSDEEDMIMYIVGTEYVNYAAFSMNLETKKCRASVININENIPHSTIIDYFNSKYNVFANGTAADGSQYAWTDGPSVAESTLGIVYKPSTRNVTYQPLGSAANVKAGIMDVNEIDGDFVKKAETNQSVFFNGIKKNKENLLAHKTQHFKTIIKNYNK